MPAPVPASAGSDTTAPVTAPMTPATGYEAVARAAAQKYGIDPDIFARQIGQESGFNPNAVSPAGARGIAQFMPETARGLGINPDDPGQALDGAAWYMAQLVQNNGGDVAKALAAYNAGQGNVDKYGGVPPFAETQRYVANIVGGAGQAVQNAGQALANTGAGRIVTAAVNNVVGALRPSQFGVGLSDAEAYAACGPVAAMAFARATGQNPTAAQAVQLAKQVGWTPQQGMAGPSSELDLLKNMGVPAHMENGADPSKIAQDVQNGNPVIISTPGHYFVADSYDPRSGAFHVGSSGTDLKAGSEWMSLDQMQKVMGTAQATLYLDRQVGDGPSVASTMNAGSSSAGVGTPAQSGMDAAGAPAPPPSPIDTFKQKLGDAFGDLLAPLQHLFGGVSMSNSAPGPQSATGLPYSQTSTPPSPEAVSQPVLGDVGNAIAANQTNPPLAGLGSEISGSGLNQVRSQVFPNVTEPGHPTNQPFFDENGNLNVNTAVAFGGVAAPLGAKFDRYGVAIDQSPEVQAVLKGPQYDQYGVEQGFVPPTPTGALAPGDLTAPTLGRDVASTLPAGSGPLAPAATTQESTDTLQGLLQMARSRGVDTSTLEPQLPSVAADTPLSLTPVATVVRSEPSLAQQFAAAARSDASAATARMNSAQSALDRVQNQVDTAQAANPSDPILTGLNAELQDAKRQVTAASASTERGFDRALNAPASVPAGGLPPPTPPSNLLPPGSSGPSGPMPGQLDLGLNAPEIHPRIQELFGDAPEYRQIAQDGLDDLVRSGANPTQIGRYFAGLERNAGVNQPQLSVGGIGANDWFRALRNGAMAGGLSTLGHVFLNIPLQTVYSLPREAVASAFRGAPEQIPASLIGLFKGYSAGWEAASQQFRYGLSNAEAATGDLTSVTPALRATNPLAETTYNALQGLVSTHGVAQTFMENVGFIQKLTQQAWTIAKNEGLNGAAFTERVEQIVQNAAIDPQYSDMLATAQQYGQRMALRGAQGTLGRGARGIAQAGPLGNLLVPFEGIAYNVVTRGIELTPAGILGTGLDAARRTVGLGPYAAGASKAGSAAVAPASERLANNVLGLGLLAYGLDLATHGRVVGHGPDDPTERRAWLDQGGQPDSFVVGGQPNASGQIVGGRYISGHLFGQFFYPFAAASSFVESRQANPNAPIQDQMADTVRRMSEYVSNETWLRSVAQITDALKTEGGAAQKLETLAANMAESFVPQTALVRNVEQATDPYVRQAVKGDLVGRLATAYPGLAGTQPIRQSLTGEPVMNPNQGVGIFAPTGRGTPDPVIQLFGNAGMGVPPPPTHVRVTSKYEMDLQPDEQRQYQDLRGQALRELTQEFVREPDFASLPIEKQRTYLEKAMTKADDVARKQFLDQMPDDQIEQRVLAYQGLKTPKPFAYVGSR